MTKAAAKKKAARRGEPGAEAVRSRANTGLAVTRERINPSLFPMLRRVDELTPDPQNARLHTEKNLDALKFSLSRFGQQKPIVLTRTDVIAAGNGLHSAAVALGWQVVAAIQIDTDDPQEARAFALADNRTAELSEWDFSALGNALAELGGLEFPLPMLGWTETELKLLSVGEFKARPEAAAELEADDSRSAPIHMTKGQREVFNRAAAQIREREGDTEGKISDGRVVELLAAEWLS